MAGRRNSRGRFIKGNVPWNKRLDSIKDSILESGKLNKGISYGRALPGEIRVLQVFLPFSA